MSGLIILNELNLWPSHVWTPSFSQISTSVHLMSRPHHSQWDQPLTISCLGPIILSETNLWPSHVWTPSFSVASDHLMSESYHSQWDQPLTISCLDPIILSETSLWPSHVWTPSFSLSRSPDHHVYAFLRLFPGNRDGIIVKADSYRGHNVRQVSRSSLFRSHRRPTNLALLGSYIWSKDDHPHVKSTDTWFRLGKIPR